MRVGRVPSAMLQLAYIAIVLEGVNRPGDIQRPARTFYFISARPRADKFDK